MPLDLPEDGHGFNGAMGFNGNIQVAQNHGFRGFRYNVDGSFTSLVFDYDWQPGVNRAVCAANTSFSKPARECPFPHKGCSHGFYAYYDEDYYRPGWARELCIVNGVINGFGRCVIGDKGYRSEYATVVAFVRPFRIDADFCKRLDLDPHQAETWVCEQLERRFPTVPIFDSVEELKAVIPLPGRPPRNDDTPAE
jgi:hypothetical protein